MGKMHLLSQVFQQQVQFPFAVHRHAALDAQSIVLRQEIRVDTGDGNEHFRLTVGAAADLAAQALPELAAQSYRLCDKGGRVAVYRCGTDGQPEVLITITGIYTNLLPENDAVRIKRGVTVYSERELDLLLEDLGG